MKQKSTARLQVVPEKTAAWDEGLRLWLVKYLEETGMSTTEFARHCGGSRTMYDSYIKCTYHQQLKNPEDSKVEKLLRAYRARVEGPNAEGRSDFVRTIAWHQLRTAIQTAIEENSITLAYGGFGRGKTRCTQEFIYKKLKTPAVHIACSPNITVRYFLQKIAAGLNIKGASWTIPQLEDEIVDYLKNHPRVVVVDQANYLPPKALGSIAYIWEESRAPVTLIGTQTLYENFYSPKMTSDERGQLASRVAMQYPLAGLDLATVKAVCQRVLGNEFATPAVVKQIFERVGGKFNDQGDAQTANFRSLEFRLRRLQRYMKVHPDKSIDEAMKDVDRMLMAA
jgi:DNA transposition AAA+ family ATPase